MVIVSTLPCVAAENEKTPLIEETSFEHFKKHFEPEWVFGLGFSRVDMSAAKSNVSVNLGIRGNYYFKSAKKGFFLNGAALLSRRGFTLAGKTVSPFYFEVPVRLGYRFSIKGKITIFGDFGPYLAVGLFGTVDGKNVFGDDELRRIDIGFGFRIGCVIKEKYVVAYNYDFGAKDMYENVALKNRNYMLSLGYIFWDYKVQEFYCQYYTFSEFDCLYSNSAG